jgi:hypothetical protein
MAKKKAKSRIAAAAAPGPPVHGATPRDITITLNGKEYHLLFNFAALELAEMKLAAAGIHLSMLLMVDMRGLSAQRLPYLFFASLVTKHPGITFAEAKALITLRTALPIHNAVCDAYMAGMVDPHAAKEKEPDPTPEPAAE